MEMGLTVLGNTVRGALDAEGLEAFEAPEGLSAVEFATEELTSFCPVTEQPDLYRATIYYKPNGKCVESKTLKLYLHGYRGKGIFGEALAAAIAHDIHSAIEPRYTRVTVIQQVRGGLQLTCVSELGDENA